jgi:cbb3-type cytochrome oxidase maturation protein
MTALLILIPVALLLGLLGLGGFLWSMRSGQFDDLDGAGSRILFDDEGPRRQAAPVPHPQPRGGIHG